MTIWRSRDESFFLIAGPCVIEDEGLTREIAAEAKKITAELGIPFIFKASFDKANRSSIGSARGPGMEKGLPILARIKADLSVPVLSDIHEPWQAETAARVLSVIQIPAFLSRQTDLLLAAARTGLPLNIKKSQMMSPADIAAGREQGRRGRQPPRHAHRARHLLRLQQPGGRFPLHPADEGERLPGGHGRHPLGAAAQRRRRRFGRRSAASSPCMAAAGITAGANGVFLEVHPRPEKALSDGKNSLPLQDLRPLLIRLQKLYNVA